MPDSTLHVGAMEVVCCCCCLFLLLTSFFSFFRYDSTYFFIFVCYSSFLSKISASFCLYPLPTPACLCTRQSSFVSFFFYYHYRLSLVVLATSFRGCMVPRRRRPHARLTWLGVCFSFLSSLTTDQCFFQSSTGDGSCALPVLQAFSLFYFLFHTSQLQFRVTPRSTVGCWQSLFLFFSLPFSLRCHRASYRLVLPAAFTPHRSLVPWLLPQRIFFLMYARSQTHLQTHLQGVCVKSCLLFLSSLLACVCVGSECELNIFQSPSSFFLFVYLFICLIGRRLCFRIVDGEGGVCACLCAASFSSFPDTPLFLSFTIFATSAGFSLSFFFSLLFFFVVPLYGHVDNAVCARELFFSVSSPSRSVFSLRPSLRNEAASRKIWIELCL